MAKIIVHGDDRPAAIQNMENALRQCRLEGVHSNLALHRRICSDPKFRAGRVDTGYFEYLEQSRAGGGHG